MRVCQSPHESLLVAGSEGHDGDGLEWRSLVARRVAVTVIPCVYSGHQGTALTALSLHLPVVATAQLQPARQRLLEFLVTRLSSSQRPGESIRVIWSICIYHRDTTCARVTPETKIIIHTIRRQTDMQMCMFKNGRPKAYCMYACTHFTSARCAHGDKLVCQACSGKQVSLQQIPTTALQLVVMQLIVGHFKSSHTLPPYRVAYHVCIARHFRGTKLSRISHFY